MTPTTDETAEGRGDDGDGLCGSVTDASTQAVPGTTMAGQRPYSAPADQRKPLPLLASAAESSERPEAVVGQKLSRKSRFRRRAYVVTALQRGGVGGYVDRPERCSGHETDR